MFLVKDVSLSLEWAGQTDYRHIECEEKRSVSNQSVPPKRLRD